MLNDRWSMIDDRWSMINQKSTISKHRHQNLILSQIGSPIPWQISGKNWSTPAPETSDSEEKGNWAGILEVPWQVSLLKAIETSTSTPKVSRFQPSWKWKSHSIKSPSLRLFMNRILHHLSLAVYTFAVCFNINSSFYSNTPVCLIY